MSSVVSTNEVTVLYDDILFRAPDPAGLSAWATALDAGTSIAQVTSDFVTSAEAQNVVDPIIRLYEATFARAPDAGGLAFWVTQAHNGMSAQAIAQSFAQPFTFPRASLE